jgi:hypothetical protein
MDHEAAVVGKTDEGGEILCQHGCGRHTNVLVNTANIVNTFQYRSHSGLIYEPGFGSSHLRRQMPPTPTTTRDTQQGKGEMRARNGR